VCGFPGHVVGLEGDIGEVSVGGEYREHMQRDPLRYLVLVGEIGGGDAVTASR
jgi:hypothetical protein